MASKKRNNTPKKTSKAKQTTAAKKAPAQGNLTPKASMYSWKLRGIAIAIMVITAFVYQGVLDNDFVDWDDYKYVINNDLVRASADIESTTVLRGAGRTSKATTSPHQTTLGHVFTRSVALNYHPLTILTMRWNNNADPNAAEGISARPFLLWNLILHLLNSVLVLLLIYRLSKNNLWGSTFVALIFALHPMHVESVAWVSERKDVLYSFFFLLGLLSYWTYLETAIKKWFWGAFGLFILACLSKAMAVVFPLILMLLHFWKAKEEPMAALKSTLSSKTWLPLLPFFLVSLFFGAIAVNIQAGGDVMGLLPRSTNATAIADTTTFNFVERFQYAGYGFVQYFVKFFWPMNLSPYYPYPDEVSFNSSIIFKLAPVLMLLILGAALLSLRKTKALAMGIGFYFFTVILVLQFLSVGMVVMADRYSYLPYIGLGMAIVFLVQHYLPKKKQTIAFGSLIGLSLLLSLKTMAQIEVWQNSETLWTTAIVQQTKDGQALSSNMAKPLSIRGGYYAKRAQSSKSRQENQQFLQKAFADYTKAAQLGSTDPAVYEGLGTNYGMRGNAKQDQARQLQQKGKAREAQALQQQAYQDFQKAIDYYGKIIKLDPSKSNNAYFNRGLTYSILRDHPKAIADYTVFIKNSPQPVGTAYVNRGISYFELKQYPAAQADFEFALRLNPRNGLAKKYLQNLRAK